jgi:hypothetical protein
MRLNLGATGVTLFTIGNLSSSASTFSNTTSGGLAGTTFVPPTTDTVTGTLLDNITIPVNGFVDAGGFTTNGGDSAARVTVTYNFTSVTAGVPEPLSALLVGGGLLAVALIGRRALARR